MTFISRALSFSKNGNIARRFSSKTGFRPRRSLLYVPGNESKKVKKAASLEADVVVLDMEDGVAQSMKDTCRQAIVDVLPGLSFSISECAVRVNSADTPYAEQDVDALLCGATMPDAIMLPKIECKEHVQWLKSKVCHHFENVPAIGHSKKLAVIGQCETAIGMMNLKEIVSEAVQDDKYLAFEAFVFGSDDYLASIGGARTKDAMELLFARQYFIMHVKGLGLHAIDMVDIEFNDLEGLKKQSEEGAKMGFTGKQIIHPKQINVVNASFSPSVVEVDFARRLIQAFNEHQESGKGAFSFEGKMIDMPSLKQAQNTIRLAEVVADC